MSKSLSLCNQTTSFFFHGYALGVGSVSLFIETSALASWVAVSTKKSVLSLEYTILGRTAGVGTDVSTDWVSQGAGETEGGVKSTLELTGFPEQLALSTACFGVIFSTLELPLMLVHPLSSRVYSSMILNCPNLGRTGGGLGIPWFPL